jgi:RNA polymerase sigma factor (sigma-70 family)
MEPGVRLYAVCLQITTALNEAQGWKADQAELEELATAGTNYISEHDNEAQIARILTNMYVDRAQVTALQQRMHAHHHEAWAGWLERVHAILWHKGLVWTPDDAVDMDDLTQVALTELAIALPNYRYLSRFSTWAYQVIANSVQRYKQRLQAQKRSCEVDRQVELRDVEVSVGDRELPEYVADNHALEQIVEEALLASQGERNTRIFWLWARADLAVETISAQVGLSVARVHAIIAQSRKELRVHEHIQRWSGHH